MKLYIVRPGPWRVVLVRAESEEEARRLAEDFRGAPVEEVSVEGPPEVVLEAEG